jgi:predicted PurR-regulated permease PerM
MEISDIISSILAILTFIGIIVALGLGVYSFRENRKLLAKQFKNKLLNDVLSWSLDVAECGHELVFRDWMALKSSTQNVGDMALTQSTAVGNLYLTYLKVWYRGEYIKEISSLLGTELQNLVNELMNRLSEEIDSCNKYKDKFAHTTGGIAEFREVMDDWVKESKEQTSSTAKAQYALIRGISKVVREYSE